MEMIVDMLKMALFVVVLVVAMEAATRGFQKIYPRPPQQVRIVVEHRIAADGINGTVDITTEVLSVAMAIEGLTKSALNQEE